MGCHKAFDHCSHENKAYFDGQKKQQVNINALLSSTSILLGGLWKSHWETSFAALKPWKSKDNLLDGFFRNKNIVLYTKYFQLANPGDSYGLTVLDWAKVWNITFWNKSKDEGHDWN